MLINVRPSTRSAKARSPRASTLSIAAPSTSMRITTSHRTKTSAASFATAAPASARTAHFEGDRFQTRSGLPAFKRFKAIGSPMAPRPMKPTRAEGTTVMSALPFLRRNRPDRCRKPCVSRGIDGPVLHLAACGVLAEEIVAFPVLRRSDWPRREPAATIRADVAQNPVRARRTEGALIRADARLARPGWQGLVAVFAGRSQLEHFRILPPRNRKLRRAGMHQRDAASS